MFEDILRSAKKANGESLDKPPTYPMVKTPQYDAPTKWYEKKWGVGLMLIICFPLLITQNQLIQKVVMMLVICLRGRRGWMIAAGFVKIQDV